MFMKKVYLMLLFFVCALSCFAQIEEGDENFGQKSTTRIKSQNNTEKKGRSIVVKTKNYNYEFSLGIRVGGGVSTMSEGDDLHLYDGSGMAFGGGIAANVRFGGKDSRNRPLDGQGLLGIGLELNYKNLSVKTLADEDLKLGYFEVPVMLQLYPMYNSKQLKNLFIELGATFAGSMSASPESLSYQNVTYKTGDLKGFDVRPTVGLGYRFNKSSANDGFYMNARYYLGSSDLAGNFPSKISCAEISVGYLFKCIGTKK